MIKGVDVSDYQPAAFDTTGLDFAFTKISEGLSYINPHWTRQRDHTKNNGLVWGAYHYPHMANDPVKEADFFLGQVAWQSGDIIVLDWEGYDSANKTVPRSRQIAYRDAWLAYVKSKMGAHRVGMYCNTDYWTRVDTTGNCGDFLWIATAGAPAGQPGIKAPWTFHQYSTANDIDHDVAAFDSRAALAAWASSTQEDPVALTADDISKVADAVVAKLLAGGGALEDGDLKRIWSADVIPAAQPPYNNSDYDTNKTWTATYAQYTQVMGIREILARLKQVQSVLAELDPAALEAALVAKLNGLQVQVTVNEPKAS